MKTPFWFYQPHAISTLLAPLSWVYNRVRRKPHDDGVRVEAKVICIGNVVAGGGGKTPVALALGKLLKEQGRAAFYVSRGYGGRLAGPVRVDVAAHTVADIGDEPLLLARQLPTIVSRDRVAGAQLAVDQGADIILMDDGLQNPSLHKDVSVLVIKGEQPFGNGKLLPAGPLREPLAEAYARVDAVVWVDGPSIKELDPALRRGDKLPLIYATSQLTLPEMRTRRVVGFAGIARPELFKQSLEQAGLEVVAFKAFGDHHPYSMADIKRLNREAACHDALLITTAKDALRLPKNSCDSILIAEHALLFEAGGLETIYP